MSDAQDLSNQTERELEAFLKDASSIGRGQDSSVPGYVGEDQEIKPPSLFETANLSNGGTSSGFAEQTLDIVKSDNTAGQKIFLTKSV